MKWTKVVVIGGLVGCLSCNVSYAGYQYDGLPDIFPGIQGGTCGAGAGDIGGQSSTTGSAHAKVDYGKSKSGADAETTIPQTDSCANSDVAVTQKYKFTPEPAQNEPPSYKVRCNWNWSGEVKAYAKAKSDKANPEAAFSAKADVSLTVTGYPVAEHPGGLTVSAKAEAGPNVEEQTDGPKALPSTPVGNHQTYTRVRPQGSANPVESFYVSIAAWASVSTQGAQTKAEATAQGHVNILGVLPLEKWAPGDDER